MAFGDLIQSISAAGNSDSPSATLSGAITEGNLVVALFAVDDGVDLSTPPSGYNEDVVHEDTVFGNSIFSKLAGSGESTTVSATLASAQEWTVILAEFEGPFDAVPLDKTVSNAEGDVDTDGSTGTTAATAQADELLVATWVTQDGDPVLETPAVSNSFTLHEADSVGGALGNVGGFLASRVVTATGAFESTLTWSTTGSRCVGAMATYKKGAGGGGTVFQESYAGTLTSAGAVTKQAQKPLAGAITSAGTVVKQVQAFYAGTLTTAGVVAKLVSKTFAGALASAGAVTSIAVKLISLAGTLTSAGVLTRQTNKVLAGTLTPTGALTKQVAISLAGTVASAGSLTKRIGKAFAGAISTLTGALTAEAVEAAAVVVHVISLTGRFAKAISLSGKSDHTINLDGRADQ